MKNWNKPTFECVKIQREIRRNDAARLYYKKKRTNQIKCNKNGWWVITAQVIWSTQKM